MKWLARFDLKCVRTAREPPRLADWIVTALRSAVSQAVTGRDIDVNALFDLESSASLPKRWNISSDLLRVG